jgi:cell division protein FtsQ
MTTLQKTTRANAVRQRRSSQKNPQPGRERSKPAVNIPAVPKDRGRSNTKPASRKAYHPKSLLLPVEPRPVSPTALNQMKGRTLKQAFGVSSPAITQRTSIRTKAGSGNRMVKEPRRSSGRAAGKGYDVAFSLGRTAVRAPLLSLPNLGPRWISAGLTFLLGLLIYTMATANTFQVGALEVTGNQRLSVEDVSNRLGLTGKPIFNVVPAQIVKDLRTAFPDLASVKVAVGFPNHLRIAVVERTPILAWFQDDNTTWIDSNGIAFTPRGDVPGLIQIASSGIPPRPAADPQTPINDQAFIAPAMVQAIVSLFPQVPGGAPMIYDPKYGMGWQDPRGWSVYFGQNTQEIDMKKKIYQAILDTFSQKGIQPTLISVAYLDAPFYK